MPSANKKSISIFVALLVTIVPLCFVAARPDIGHGTFKSKDSMMVRSHHKAKRAWDSPLTPIQDEPILSIVEETNVDNIDVEGETNVDSMWLDISKDFRDKTIISKNADGELECDAVGSPPPKVFWFRNGTPIESATTVTNDNLRNMLQIGGNDFSSFKLARSGMANVKAKLPIRCALPEDEGHYTCVAINRGKHVSATTHLSVIENDGSAPRGGCEYRLSSMSFKKSKKGSSATIINSQSFHMETMGKHISLPCKSVGKPRPQVTWYDQDGEKIIHGKKYQVSSSGSLVIRSLVWKDMGVYTCTTENMFGKDSTTTFVYPLAEETEETS